MVEDVTVIYQTTRVKPQGSAEVIIPKYMIKAFPMEGNGTNQALNVLDDAFKCILLQRDTTGLSSENTELKLRLQAMEQQAQLRDALNEALKQEVERLRIATGEISNTSDTFNLAMQHVPYNQSAFFPPQPQSVPNESRNVQMPQFHPMLSSAHLRDSLQQDPLGRFQGLDISSGRGSHIVKSEGPSISASESSSTF